MCHRSDSSVNYVKSVDSAANIMDGLSKAFDVDSICEEGSFVFVNQPDVLYSDFASPKTAGHLKRRMTKAQETKGGVSRSVANVHGEVDVAELVKKVERTCGYKVMELDGTSKIMIRLRRGRCLHVNSSAVVGRESPSYLSEAPVSCDQREDKR